MEPSPFRLLMLLREQFIVHKDLKAENVMMVSRDHRSKIVAKVTDFGTSKVRCVVCLWSYSFD